MVKLVRAGETTAAKRRVYFLCVDATDGITPETGEAGGQPEISINGGEFAADGIGALVGPLADGTGWYYAELDEQTVSEAGRLIQARYKSANTAEIPAQQSVQTVAFDPDAAANLGLTNLDKPVSLVGGAVMLSAMSSQITAQASGEAISGSGNITVVRGTTVTIAFTAMGKALEGHEVWMTVRPDRADLEDPEDATAVFTVQASVASDTEFAVTLTPAQTDKCDLGRMYWYEIRDVTAGDCLIIARFAVVGSVVKRA